MKIKKINKKQLNSFIRNLIFPIIALTIILLFWVIVSAIKNNPLVLPMPGIVLKRFFILGKEYALWKSVGATILRSLIAFLISFIFALSVAILSGLVKNFNKIISPIVAFLRAAPTVAVILIIYAFMSTDIMTIVVGFLIAFPIMYSSFYTSISEIDENLKLMAKIYKVNFFRRIFNIYILSISGNIFDTSKATLSLTIKIVIAAEILTSVSPGIGGKIQTAYASFEIEYLLAWTLLAIVLSFVSEFFIGSLKKLVIRWEK